MKRIRLLFLYTLALLAGPLARRPSDALRSVLYIKPDHLGDVLLATPALAALREAMPETRIVALVGPWSAIVLRRNTSVDGVLTCPFPGFERPVKDNGLRQALVYRLSSIVYRLLAMVRPYWLLLRYALLLRAGRYDAAVIGRDDHWWGAALALLAGIPCRVGFAVPECRPFLTDALPWNPRAHVTAQGLELVESVVHSPWSVVEDIELQTTDDGQRTTRFEPAVEDIGWADVWLRSQNIAAGSRLIVVHPGTGGRAKLWFPERWAAVADALADGGARVVLTGGPGEQALVEAVAARMRKRPPTLAGQTTLGQLAALLRRASLVLGVDSGPLHVAVAEGVPTMHLYGPGDEGRFGPWGDPERHRVVRAGLWCSPCGVFDTCPRGLERPECMERISVEQVVAVARQLLAS
jgi:heptosyltransferase-2/heptosyltransferase-3